MFLRKRLLGVLLVLALVLPISFLWAGETQAQVTDLTKAYEIWKNKGIRFVVRTDDGKFSGWGIGRLESWSSKSRWVVRDPKGHFLIHAFGNVEHWKNGKTRLVLRTPKGQILTLIDIALTDKGSFAQNVVGLRKLKGDSKFIGFVQETLAEHLINDLKQNDTIKTKVLLDYIRKNQKSRAGMENFIPVLRAVVRQLNFMAGQGNDPVIESLATAAREMLKDLE